MSHDKLNYLQQIRTLGYRLTPQRELILNTLCSMNSHATVNQIYERVRSHSPAINRATIYRTLSFFHQLQMVSESQINGTTVYEIAQEHPHHHLVCRCCGFVAVLDNHHFQALADHLLGEHGFKAQLDHLTISGVCTACQETGDCFS